MTTLSIGSLATLRWFRLAPAARVSLGLSALLVSCLLMADVVFGLIPDETALHQKLRQKTTENLAIQIAALLEAGDSRALSITLNRAVARDGTIRSVGVRTNNGVLVLQVGEHTRHWVPPPEGESTLDHVRVSLLVNQVHWGDVEVSYRPVNPEGWIGVLHQPIVVLCLVLGLGGFVLFSLYLRRVLEYLDPSNVIPERVRVAFDSFTEGVMILDPSGRIMLANAALRSWVMEGDASLHGRAVQDVPALRAALPGEAKDHPWARAMASHAPLKGEYIEIMRDGAEPTRATVNCAPVLDGRRQVRGCIVTFNDITEIERLNRKLVATVEELGESKAQIERQNEELRKLATRDPLTNCLNRRAFFEKLDALFVAAQTGTKPLVCIMSDIDHFKSFNDRFGHAIGDRSLQVVSRSLFAGLRDCDLLCRYGGEEFCIVLPDIDLEQGVAVAERLRSEIEQRAGRGIRSTQGIKITSSFGVAVFEPGIADPAMLIERADVALYQSKHTGRNRVTVWKEGMKQES